MSPTDWTHPSVRALLRDHLSASTKALTQSVAGTAVAARSLIAELNLPEGGTNTDQKASSLEVQLAAQRLHEALTTLEGNLKRHRALIRPISKALTANYTQEASNP